MLPPEDLSNPCLSVLVSEIFSEMIVHNGFLGKACEPWLLWEGVTKAIYTLRPNVRMPKAVNLGPTNRLEHFGLLASTQAVRQDQRGARQGILEVIGLAFWSILQYAVIAWMLMHGAVTALMQLSSTQPLRRRMRSEPTMAEKVYNEAVDSADGPSRNATPEKRPVVGMRAWRCLQQLTSLHSRMPWFTGSLSLLQWLSVHGPGRVCRTNSALDR